MTSCRVLILCILSGFLLASAASARDFVCESNKGKRKRCDVGRRIDDVRLVEQLSNAACREGRSFGHDDRGVWVSDGCRGRFEVAVSPRERIDCNSKEGRRRRCNADFDLERAILIRQKSDADCRQGRSWGFDRDGVWVDRGCRAEFELVGRPEFGRRVASDDDDSSGALGAVGALAGLAAIGAIVAGSQSQPEPPPPAPLPPPRAQPAPGGGTSDLPWLDPPPPPPPSRGSASAGSGETLPWLEPGGGSAAPAPAGPSGFTPPAPGPAIPAAHLGTFRGFDPAAGGELELRVREDGSAELRSGALRWDGRYTDAALVLGGVRYELRSLDGGIALRPADGRAPEVRFDRVLTR